MNNYSNDYQISVCEKCCEYNEREQKRDFRIRKYFK